MLLKNGVFNGEQIISENYIQMATSKQIIKQDDVDSRDKVFEDTGYGFQFHIGKDNCYRLDGAFGQLCIICPDKNIAVIVFSNYSKMEILLSLIYKHLLNKKIVCESILKSCNLSEVKSDSSMIISCKKYKLQQANWGKRRNI